MTEYSETERQAKGLNLVDFVKSLRVYRRNHSLVGLSPDVEALLDERILINKWYPYEAYIEVMYLFYRHFLSNNPEHALKAGIVGGLNSLQGIHRGFVTEGDPATSLYAMRHVWKTMFNFGDLVAKVVGDRSVRFILSDYPDIPEAHAMLLIGWDIAAAQLAGARDVNCTLEQRPWQGDPELVYLINFE